MFSEEERQALAEGLPLWVAGQWIADAGEVKKDRQQDRVIYTVDGIKFEVPYDDTSSQALTMAFVVRYTKDAELWSLCSAKLT